MEYILTAIVNFVTIYRQLYVNMVFHAPKHEFQTQTSHFAVKLISNSNLLDLSRISPCQRSRKPNRVGERVLVNPDPSKLSQCFFFGSLVTQVIKIDIFIWKGRCST